MVNQLIRQLTVKKIIWIVIILSVSIYVTYYVVDALDGFDPNYRPTAGLDGWASPGGTGMKGFDPSEYNKQQELKMEDSKYGVYK